jgi:hypothetical protein
MLELGREGQLWKRYARTVLVCAQAILQQATGLVAACSYLTFCYSNTFRHTEIVRVSV